MNESLKLALRTRLHRRNVAIGRDPHVNRVARAVEHFGVDTVLDVGANVGQFATMMRAAGFEGLIVSCEPLSNAFETLRRRAAGDPSWSLINQAVGATAGEATINIAGNSYSSSMRDMSATHVETDPSSAYTATEHVRTTTVESIVADLGLEPETTMLKVDTQGFEREVLMGAGERLEHFRLVQLEMSWVRLYEGQALGDELAQMMGRRGFTIFGMDPGIADRKTGRLLQSDVLFARE